MRRASPSRTTTSRLDSATGPERGPRSRTTRSPCFGTRHREPPGARRTFSEAQRCRFRSATQSLSAVVTDPPYDNMIDYSDASDLFYVWLKRALYIDSPVVRVYLPRAGRSGEGRRSHRQTVPGVEDSDGPPHPEPLRHDRSPRAFTEARRVVHPMTASSPSSSGTATPRSGTGSSSAITRAGLVLTGSWPAKTEAGGSAGSANIVTTLTMSCRPAPPGRPVGPRQPRRGGGPQGGQGSHPDVGRGRPGPDRPAHGIGRTGDGGGGTVRTGARIISAIPSTPLTTWSSRGVPSKKPPRSSSTICRWKPSTYARASPCRGPGCTAGPWRRNPRRAGRRWRRTCRATNSRASSKRRTRVSGSAMPRTGKARRQRPRRRSTSPWRWPRPGRRVSTPSPRSWWRRDGTPPTTTCGPRSGTCRRCCPRPTPMRWHGRRSCAGGAASGRSRVASCRRDGKPPTCRKPRTGRAASSTRTGRAA